MVGAMPVRSRIALAVAAVVLATGVVADVLEAGAVAHVAALVATIGSLVALAVLLPGLAAASSRVRSADDPPSDGL